MDPLIINLSARQLRRAAEIKEHIEALQTELNELAGTPSAPTSSNGSGRKRHMSAEAIARISAAQKARWAKVKRAAGPSRTARKGKRRMSAAARARLAEVARARWRNVKAAGKTKL